MITHWSQQRRHLYREASAGSERDQLDDVSAELARVTGRAIHAEQPLTSWRAVFAAFEELLADGPIAIAIDEFQFVARRDAEIGSLVNRFVAPFESRLQSRDAARRHLEETVLPRLDAFVSRDALEEVCQRWALAHVPDALDKLETVATLMGAETAPPLYFFDRTGLSPRLRAIARERDDVRLVTTAELAAG